MPRFAITGPDGIQYDWRTADNPLQALHKLHGEALGFRAVPLRDGQLVFRDRADQELCAGGWRVTQLGRNGPKDSSTVEITIAMPIPVAA